jgi:hypothetical protein
MTSRPFALVAAAIATAAAPAPVAAEEAPAVTTSEWSEPRAPLDLQWHALALPEYAIELAFTPVRVAVAVVERYRVDKRVYDLLRNDAGTVKVTPKVKLSGGEGLGLGGVFTLKRLDASEMRLDTGGVYRLDGDYELTARLQRVLATLDGRLLELRVDREVDQNLPYYGIGNDAPDEETAIRDESIDMVALLDLTGRGFPEITGVVELGLRYNILENGTDPTAPGIVDAGLMPLPPGFGESIMFPRIDLSLRYDTRDNIGRPNRGYTAEVHARYTQDVSGEDLSAAAGRLVLNGYVPVLPNERVLNFYVGIAGAIAPGADDEIPFHELVTLGRKNGLRGYGRSRFRDDFGWWGGVEYRFPIWEYINSGVALTPAVFFDVGRVGSRGAELVEFPLRYSYGLGLRAAHDTLLVFRLQLGRSSEGLQLDFSLGKEL